MVNIRKATIEDTAILEDFQKQLYGDWFDASHSDLAQAIGLGHVWVAADEDGVVGYQLCELFGPSQKNFPNSVFLSELFVVPEHRKQGIGSRLVSIALNEPWPAEYGYFSLTHDPDEALLTTYYEKFGFTKCGMTKVGNVKMTRPRDTISG